jgi:DNA-binding transcriptional MerR regulator
MPDLFVQVDIPNRALFKAAEVCDLIKVQPYVLRSWESEFPTLGVAKSAGGPRVYRRVDVEQAARIKHLLLVEGLTLAGARRRLEEEIGPVAVDTPAIDELIGQHARERLTTIKRGLHSILELLAEGGVEFRLAPPPAGRAAADGRSGARPNAIGRVKPSRSAATRDKGLARNGSRPARRKRPA